MEGVAIYNYCYSAPIIIRIQISIVLKVKGGIGYEGSVLCEKSRDAGGRALMEIQRLYGVYKKDCIIMIRRSFRHLAKISRILLLQFLECTTVQTQGTIG